MYDVYVVGAGLSGAVVARHMAEKGSRVLIFERRDHIAGNLYDYTHESGIRVQKYGPHIFHTQKPELFEYLASFGSWAPFNLECMVYMNGRFTPSPFNYKTIDDYYEPRKAADIKAHLGTAYPGASKTTIVDLLSHNDPIIKEYANFLYENDYSLYTAKQWGISPSDIDLSVLKRVPVLLSYKTGYFDDFIQMMPCEGYTNVVERILDHSNIKLELGIDALSYLKVDTQKNSILINGESISAPVIYTGPLDELLGYRLGRLPYRSLFFEWETANTDSFQDAPVVAYPQTPDYTRITEYNKLPIQFSKGFTVYAKEFPVNSDISNEFEPYYPIPTEENICRYTNYRDLIKMIPNLHLCGRLADYKYYNMDQAIEKALILCTKLDTLYR